MPALNTRSLRAEVHGMSLCTMRLWYFSIWR